MSQLLREFSEITQRLFVLEFLAQSSATTEIQSTYKDPQKLS